MPKKDDRGFDFWMCSALLYARGINESLGELALTWEPGVGMTKARIAWGNGMKPQQFVKQTIAHFKVLLNTMPMLRKCLQDASAWRELHRQKEKPAAKKPVVKKKRVKT